MDSNVLQNGYQLGEYAIESVLGKGGFGITYLARDTKLGARVAIKEYFPQGLAVRNQQLTIVSKPGNATNDYQWGLQQFLKEAQALARFKHNHIVRVLRFLELNGTAYMIMEYEQGQGLQDYMKENGQLEEKMLLQIFVPVLNGLQAVHSAGLLHLDIKPDNIYLRADGQPMLIDFGSARQTARGPDAEERIALTPAYAAIEQYPDKGKQGPWTDIYSIGASLYHCISGKQPVDALRRYQSLLKYKADPLTPASKLEQSGYSEYLRECVDWAMQIYPSHRPKGAIELQEGLMGKGRPTKKSQPIIAPKAKPQQPEPEPEPTLQDKIKRLDLWKVTLVGLSTLLVLGVVFVSIAYWQYRNRPRVEAVATESTTTNSIEEQRFAQEALEKARLAEQATELAERPIFSRYNNIKLINTVNAHQASVESLAFLANGLQLASASEDGTIKVWDVQTGKLVTSLKGHQVSVHALVVSPNGRVMVSAGNETELLVWDLRNSKLLGTLSGHDYEAYALAFSSDGQLLASSGKGRTVIIWDMNRRQALKVLEGHKDTVLTVAFSPGNRILLSGGEDGQLKFWDVASGKEITSLYGHQGLVSAASFSPDGKWFATAGRNNLLRIWDAQTGEQQRTMTQAPNFISSLGFTPDSKHLFAGGSDHIVRIWHVESGRVDHELKGHEDSVRTVVLSPDNKVIASAGKDKTIRLWKMQPPQEGASAAAP